MWQKFPVGWTHPRYSEMNDDGMLVMFDHNRSIPARGGEVSNSGPVRTFEYKIFEKPENAYVPSHIGFRLKEGSYLRNVKIEILEDFTPGLGSLICAIIPSDPGVVGWHQLGYTWSRTKGTLFTLTGAGTGSVPLPFNAFIYFNLAPFNANVNGNGVLKMNFDYIEIN